jgi:hypothetical protein
MPKAKRRSYTPDELRDILKLLYGPGSDYELAGKAADPDQFNVDRNSVLRWLNGSRAVKGTAAQVAYLLSTRPK